MVTFSIPGDNELAEAGRATPRPRPPLPFAKRAYVSSPFTSKRLGTPQSAPSRRLLGARDDHSSNGLNKSTIASSRNIFRASTTVDSPSVTPFSPSLPQNTMKKVFTPGGTPESNRVFRESTAQVTPRGMAAKTTDKELFHMRIEDPDPELSGEALTKKIPKEWNAKGSIYADQFLAHLCPPEFDDEQRRQFFAILDLRRLKYAANEIFSKKDWKLNVINFAKEFEKSRSIILLRYGLYEFQNVKPSKDVLKRWRREHGLPEPEEENAEPTPTKAGASKKRKADDEPSKDTSLSNNKRRAGERDEEEKDKELPAGLPAPVKSKRKASLSDETESQPSKMQKSTPSAAKSLFEKIANKSSTPAGSPVKASTKRAEDSVAAKPNPFASVKVSGSAGGLARSVFQNLKPGNAQGGGNIFGYLSDASSAKNSGVDADAESEADSDAGDSQETGQSEEPSAVASGTETASQVGSGLFGIKPAPTSAPAAGSSAPGTRESTPGRSLFDRVTKNSDGQPVRQDDKPEADSEKTAAKPANQTWNPSTTPIKFAPAASTTQPSNLFGNSTSTPSSSIFAAKPSATSNIFGAKPDKSADKADKSGGESDKENDEAPKKSLFGSAAPAAPANTAASLFGLKPAAETPKAAEPAKPLFGLAKSDDKPTTTASSLFGGASKPAESTTPAAPVLQSSTLFGAKPSASDKIAEAPKAAPLFGTSTSSTPASTASNIFGAKPSTAPSTNLFGAASSATAAKPIFGGASSNDASAAKPDAPPAIFSFGGAPAGASKPNGTSEAAAKPLFAPKSPTSSAPLFGGSPMKQDAPSPAKKAFSGGSTGAAASSAPIFSFGAATTSSSAPIFGGATAAPANNNTPSFGAGSSSDTGSGSFTFGGGSGTSFNNPFASGNTGNNTESTSFGSGSTTGGMFNFGANSAPSGGSSTFQFGGGSSSSTPAPAFGANQGNNSNNPAPAFGGASSSGTPSFSFGAGSSQAPTSAPVFGSTPAPAFNLQPPVGGASTTGTNTPFSLGGGSSLATTPAGGTPEPSSIAQGTSGGGGEEDVVEKHEQISLTEGTETDEEVLHDVRAKVLKFISASEQSDDKKPKSKSPWVTQGIGSLRILKHKETNAARLLMRSEPRGNIALNRTILPEGTYKADEKYVKLMTSNDTGTGLETWMIQVKTKDLAKELAEALEKHKALNKK